jgi:tetratricopeptide (TPR) repeat protein
MSTFRNSLLLAAAILAPLAMSTGCKTYTSGLGGTATSGSASSAEAGIVGIQEMWNTDRSSAEALDAIIAKLDALITAEPNNQDALILLARAVYFRADGFTEDVEEKKALFERGVTAGEAAMAADAGFKAQIDKGVKASEAVSALQKDDQMAIYWTATNLGKWARASGFTTLVKYKGAFYAVAPGFAGGDMNKSREFFEKAKAMNPEAFSTYVLYADTYAVKTQDRELFDSLLKYVIDTPSDVIPELVAEQDVEKAKAKAMMAKASELFAD